MVLALPFLSAAHIGRNLAMLEGIASTPETTLLITYDRQWFRSVRSHRPAVGQMLGSPRVNLVGLREDD